MAELYSDGRESTAAVTLGQTVAPVAYQPTQDVYSRENRAK